MTAWKRTLRLFFEDGERRRVYRRLRRYQAECRACLFLFF